MTLIEAKKTYDDVVRLITARKFALLKAGRPRAQVDSWADNCELVAATNYDVFRMELKVAACEKEATLAQYALQIQACNASRVAATAKLVELEKALGIAE